MIDNAELIQDVLDMAVLERRDGRWRSYYPLPAWFGQHFLARPRRASGNGFIDSDVTSPFFEHLLDDVLALERGERCDEVAEIWVETDASGDEQFFGATAKIWRGDLVMLVRRLGDEFERYTARLQTAREELLTSERLEAQVFERTAQIREREEEIALRLLAASGVHDTETGAHVRRIGLYSAAMAEALGWPPDRVAEIRVAAPMHDLGKIGIPDRVLKKPGKLDAGEWQIMRRHAQIGARLLASDDVPLLELASEIAHSHHEHYDGGGYPRGLSGEQIPIGARIVAIVDVYDALVHRRVYKEPVEESVVIEELRALAGTQFDPHLLDVFFANLGTMRRIRRENPDDPAEEQLVAELGI